MTNFPRLLDEHERAIEAECVPLEVRVCPGCNGFRVVELSHGHDPYTGERVSLDTCPDCDGTGEIEVAPIEEEDLPE